MANSSNKKIKDNALAVPKKPERIIYVGPSLPRGELQKYMMFKGGIPEHIGHVFKRYPLIRTLFTKPAGMAETEKKMNTKGTLENAAFMQIAAGGIRPQPEEITKDVKIDADV